MRRKPVIITASVLAAALIAVAAVPWWLGAALGVVGGRYGLSFDDYRRVGYSRFALTHVRMKTGGVDVSVSRLELGTPLTWLWGKPGPVTVEDWSVKVAKPASPAPVKTEHGWVILHRQLEHILATLNRRLPSATARQGKVSWAGGRLEFGPATWTNGELTVAELRWRELGARIAFRQHTTTAGWQLDAEDIGSNWTIAAVSEGANVSVTGSWRAQPWTASAEFGPTGWWPVEAKAIAKGWSVPGAQWKLGEYYATVKGDGAITWKNRELSVDAQAAGIPVEGQEAPPLQAVLHGSGGPEHLSVDRLEFTLPGITGTLSEPISIGRDGELRSGASHFDLKADLARQPWFKGDGLVAGSVTVMPRSGGVPSLEGRLYAVDATVADWRAKQADVAVKIEWPLVKIDAAHIELPGGDRLTLGGEWNARTRTLTGGTVNGRASRETVMRWLPADVDFESLKVDARAQGVWPLINHEGRLDVEALRVAPLRPLSGSVEWKGEGRALKQVEARATAGDSQWRLAGSLDAGAARIDELVLTRAAVEQLRLVRPVAVVWRPELRIDPVELKSPAGGVTGQLEHGARGHVELQVRNFDSRVLGDWIELPAPDWMLGALDVKGAWDRGPLVFTATGAAQVNFSGGRRAELMWSARGAGDGVELVKLRATMEERAVVQVSGKVPVTIWPRDEPRLRFDKEAPLELLAITEPHAVFWEQLARVTGLQLTAPDVNVKVTGTLNKPAGEGTITIGKIAPGGAVWAKAWPEVEDAHARVTGNRDGVALETFTANVSGQSVRASGRLPVKDWTLLIKDPLAVARTDGEARIEIPDAQVSALARYAPTYLSPTGTLQVDVTLKPGGELHGWLRLKDAASRPLGPLGILQSIGAEIELDGRTVKLKDVHATTGGQPVTLTGTASLRDDRVPRLDLALKGDNLPFARQAGLLVRGDLDLGIKTGDDDVTRITGGTRLRDSLFLLDVRSLLPSGGARNAPGRRPPYFVVETPPFNAWALDVTVAGDRFLRLRTPVFNGVVSANFRLRGTLGDPRVTGEAVVNQGQVVLPFATFTVRQGRVRITEQDPFEPSISLTGTSRRYGYDLGMEISGTMDRPELTFTSTPSLQSEQVLLMVMAGETPQNEVSYTGRERAARLGAYLGQSLLGQLGADPTTSDRLSISVGERISRQGRETYDVEYGLDRRWSLVGEYDEFDEYNVGVKWRIFPRKPTADKEATDAKK